MPIDEQPRTFRTGFDQAAADYDAIRPGYPSALINDIITLSHISANGRILEIGCGTGQATLPFAQRGYQLTCLDIGPALAALAAQNCQAYPNVHIQVTSFEDWEAEPATFDLIISATAFHWIPPEIGYPKTAYLLKESGSLAVFYNEHPTATSGFLEEVQHVYRQVLPDSWSDPLTRPSLQTNINQTVATMDATGLFGPVIVKTYPWTATYTTAEYLRLISTYSPNLHLSDQKRNELFQGIADLIETRYDGRITKPYLAVLYLASLG